MNGHTSDPASFECDDDGFYVPRCACGWSFGPVPSIEDVTDVLMDHAFEEASALKPKPRVGGSS